MSLVRRYELGLVAAYHLLSTALPASWATRTLGVPLVTTLFGEVYADPAEHARRRRDIEAILDASVQVLSCSRHCAESLRSIGIERTTDVAYYGIDVDRFQDHGGADARRALGLAEDASVVAYVGRMVEEMGVDVLLDAVPALVARDVHVVVAGASGERTAAVHAAASVHAGWVHPFPDVPSEDLPLLFDAADVVVAPSLNERACLGLAIAEAMATSRAVVAADAGGTGEVVVDGQTGVIVPPGDASSLAEAVLSLLGDDARRHRMGAAGRARAHALFDNRVVCAEMEARFLRAMAGR
jgi:glycosyltransferase involved in cell wall biosynthesis